MTAPPNLLGVAIRSAAMIPGDVPVFDGEYDRRAIYPGYEIQDSETRRFLGYVWTDGHKWCWKIAGCGRSGSGWGRCDTRDAAVECVMAGTK